MVVIIPVGAVFTNNNRLKPARSFYNIWAGLAKKLPNSQSNFRSKPTPAIQPITNYQLPIAARAPNSTENRYILIFFRFRLP